MEGKKMMPKNQVLENCGRDFQMSGDIPGNGNHHQKVYGRDLLLQLRLHPLSLQKPKHLPGMDVVKENLYLHDITKTSASSNDKQVDSSNYHASLKPDYCSMKQDYQMLPHYLGRMYPYYFSPHAHDGAYSSSSKIRSSLHTYCSPYKKHSVPSPCYKDFSVDEYVWAKRCFATSEDMWNCYQNFAKKKEDLEGVPKSRKKLPIIDPVTGKNVLETVTNTNQKHQSDPNTLPKNSEPSENIVSDVTAEDKSPGDYFFNSEIDHTTSHISDDTCSKVAMSSSENKTCDKLNGSKITSKADCLNKDPGNHLTIEDTLCNYKSAPTASKEENLPVDTKAKAAHAYDDIHVMKLANELDEHDMCIYCDASKSFYNNANKTAQNKETSHSRKHDSCQTHQNLSVDNDAMKESLQQLKDKILSLREEQQKMYILQSFLRYKKYQLEETARNLDEKRISIANRECNLSKKANRLHEKEVWLESKSEILYKKAVQLAERENLLSKEESKSSGDGTCPSLFKEGDFFVKKPEFDISPDMTWNEISKNVKSSYGSGKGNDNAYFGYSSVNKVGADSSSNVELCKSDARSLDELEKNIVLIEKLHSTNEGGDGASGKLSDIAPSGTVEKKDENDSLGYSKGRRYLPEHIKYWLNKQDKSAL